MSTDWKEIARATMEGAEDDSMNFPQAVARLMEAGFDGYAADFRRNSRIYYRPDGDSVALEAAPTGVAVAARFDAAAVQAAIREAQAMVPGYTYRGFCAKVAAAGCAGYMVSLLGKRVLYYGRTGETHTEYFPGAEPGR
jgi:uncharacterized protein YbcV (DUF1398 family)